MTTLKNGAKPEKDISVRQAKLLLQQAGYEIGEYLYGKYRITLPDGAKQFWKMARLRKEGVRLRDN